jgi:16S rRNA processing protein RimM
MVINMYEYLQIGRIVNTHGIKGEVKVVPLTDDPERFGELEWLYLDKNGRNEKIYITGVKYFKNFVILKFNDIDTIEAAEALKGIFLLIDRKNAVKLPKDSFFICDLIGSTIYDEEGKLLGKLVDVLKTGSNDVFVIKDDNGSEIFLPALKSVVKEISVEAGTMKVSIPEGLL